MASNRARFDMIAMLVVLFAPLIFSFYKQQNILLSVANSGPGIPEEQIKKVTRRFYLVDESRGRPDSGHGLSLVQAIANHHEAKLNLSNTAQGLTVEVVFTA